MEIVSPRAVEEMCAHCADVLRRHGYRLVVAESCTGGWLAKVLTDLPGSSDWFDRGFVTYSNQAKQTMLGVSPATLEQQGAVSEACVIEMAQGALNESGADVAIAISGIAGPGGGSVEKPVGTVCFSWQFKGGDTETMRIRFDGDRDRVRWQAVVHALAQLQHMLNESQVPG
ncbi:MAG: damage-inducible protein CinA [gamma proteobacterium symbiont of Ctena orbiculata]|nr:MAG: damage-inducible protein CinA [gamma proteobacterium symbiont of Ctena orbiculata]PVV11962.1 MAG: damage-inducible protein CinA [gamma proteobacterium symbiont of Ctena orbiculata]PVV18342.1 MAG: damage-inducible protein CinA [gamma proteobacterium symbiont of Ctena orbiculata]